MMSELRPCRSKALDIRIEVCISKVHDVSELKHTYTDIKFMNIKSTACRFKVHDIRVVACRYKVQEISEIKAVSNRQSTRNRHLSKLSMDF